MTPTGSLGQDFSTLGRSPRLKHRTANRPEFCGAWDDVTHHAAPDCIQGQVWARHL